MPTGQLHCIPIAADIAAIWYETNPDAEIASVAVNGTPIEIVGRYRVLQLSSVLHLVVVHSGALRDGSLCELSLAPHSEPFSTQVRLAPSRSKNASRVLRFIVSRLRSIYPLGQWGPLARYLALMSSWRLNCEVIARSAGLVFAVGEAPASRFGKSITAFAHGTARITQRRISTVSLGDDAVAFILPEPLPDRAFIELGDELIQLDFRPAALVHDRQALEWLRSLPDPAKESMFARLRDIKLAGGRIELDALCWAIFPNEQRIALSKSSHLDLLMVTTTKDRLLVFAEAVGDVEIVSVQLVIAEQEITPASWSQFRRYLSPIKGAGISKRLRFVAASELSKEATGFVKIVVTTNFGRHETRISPRPCSAQVQRFSRSFFPDPTVDDGYIAEVAYPIAAAAMQRAGGSTILEFGQQEMKERGGILFTLITDGELDALHRTILAMGAMARPANFSVRLLLSVPERAEAVCQAMEDWAIRYGLAATIEIPLDDIGEANCVGRWRTDDHDDHSVIVAMRAGLVPDSSWYEAFQKLERSTRALLLTAPETAGNASEVVHENSNLDLDRILALPPGSLLGLGIPVEMLRGTDLSEPFQTPEGEWLGLALNVVRAGARVDAVPVSSFGEMVKKPVRSRVSDRTDRFILESIHGRFRTDKASNNDWGEIFA